MWLTFMWFHLVFSVNHLFKCDCMKFLLAILLMMCGQVVMAGPGVDTLWSPSGKVGARVWVDAGHVARFTIVCNGQVVLEPSALGLQLSGEDFSQLTLAASGVVSRLSDAYSLFNGKKRNIVYKANRRVFYFTNGVGNKMEVIFQVSDDGVAFRYHFPKGTMDTAVLIEKTTYDFGVAAQAWLQPMSVAKSGWEHTNPSYEEHYQQAMAVGTPSSLGAGWVYPALFKCGEHWVLITEAGLDGRWCGTRLVNDSASGVYRVSFPDVREVFTGGGLLPKVGENSYSPWRVVVVGSLKTIVESTLGTDVAAPSTVANAGFVKPGKASWSWINSKDDHIVYDEQKKYIDYAADMHWQYCLVDVNWDVKIGYDKIKELAAYGAAKGVHLLLWYNSAGDWNTVNYTPKGLLLRRESREREFARLKGMGISGVKIDFFGGDGQSMIQYYVDILNDAARYGLLVNFHGATLPRGWSRTYPQLVTTEAVKGFEMVTFQQESADVEANHCTMLPFVRNVFDPMDFTPMNLNRVYTNVQRRTTSAFELATSVVFLSGVQHFAESPEGMQLMPAYIKDFLRGLPGRWDDVRFVAGFPGKLVVIARRSGQRWYVAGMNGEAVSKELLLDLGFLKGKRATLLADGEHTFFQKLEITVPASGKVTVPVKAEGGFVLVFG